MRLAPRLRRLERVLDTRICEACGGKGILVVSHRYEDEPTPIVKGCPNCGEVMHVVITFASESLPGGPQIEFTRERTAEELGALLA